MNALLLSPTILSALLLGAHFFRADIIPVVILSLLFPFLLVFKKAILTRIVQIILIIGALEWIRTLLVLVSKRQDAGDDWLTAAIILGSVSFVTACSALPYSLSKSIKKIYVL